MTVQELELAVFSSAIALAGVGGPLLSFYLPSRNTRNSRLRYGRMAQLLAWVAWLFVTAFIALLESTAQNATLVGVAPGLLAIASAWLVYLLFLTAETSPRLAIRGSSDRDPSKEDD